ncbi:hypothetical protein L1049_020173 [Liquidambar formosana]|uniref:Uncharacterized protein n=1 Tax=Liquidambar formosana TaxID=63359 RepID=A0AAP0X5T4_LIQFO
MESLQISRIVPFKSPLNLAETTIRQVGILPLWRQRSRTGSLSLRRSVSGRKEGGFSSSQDGSSAVEDEKEGLLLGAERDGSGSVIGFHLIPQSERKKMTYSTADREITDSH